jgi:hypothetical protein
MRRFCGQAGASAMRFQLDVELALFNRAVCVKIVAMDLIDFAPDNGDNA